MLKFGDQPRVSQGAGHWPWHFKAKLEAVCRKSNSTNYDSLGSIEWGCDVDSSGHATVYPTAPISTIPIGQIVARAVPNNDYMVPGDPNHYAGALMMAFYIGCCDGGSLNWVQTVLEDSWPPNGQVPPYNDGHDNPFYWQPGNGPNGIDRNTINYP